MTDMSNWTEIVDLEGRTNYINLEEVQAVLRLGDEHCRIVMSNCIIDSAFKPAEVIQEMNSMLGNKRLDESVKKAYEKLGITE